jgi:phage minor structural protein
MIPILFSENATTFTSNGLGRLADAIKCVVREERNGAYELEMEYPITGVHFEDITESKIIYAVPADGKYPQPFRIYKIEKGIAGKIRIYAEHITYQANHIPVMPFEANTAAAAMAMLQSNAISNNPFTLWTDVSAQAHYIQEVPESIRARLGGQDGSILDLYGGEFEWDNYMIKLHQHRGQNRGVVLRYGKNILDLSQENNITSTYTAVCPYVKESEDDPLITLPEKYIAASNAGNYPYLRIKSVDFTKEFEEGEEITIAALRQKTNDYIVANNIGIPKVSIKVSFVALWQTEEYKNIAPLERVNLCDTVTVRFEKLGVDAQAKVIKTEYNVLLDRYNSIELGESKSTISATVATQEQRIVTEVDSDLLRAQKHATELITGGLGGYVVLKRNANGKPEELLIMDKENIEEAVHVWRYNKNGWGYSSTGYNGLFTLAATLDGGFVADFITTGTLNAALVKTGMLSDKAGNNYWDMVTGDFSLSPRALVGGSNVASAADVASASSSAKSYADVVSAAAQAAAERYAANSAYAAETNANVHADAAAQAAKQAAELVAKSYTDTSSSNARSAAEATARAYTDAYVTAYDNSLNQTKVFNKLTDNGRLQGIYMQNGRLYINAAYIATGILKDANSNTLFDLSNGALMSKNLTIESPFFKLSNTGEITSIATDGRKMIFDKGSITGFKTNGIQSAKLEIGDGYFNIVGRLALNGVVGVSGSTSFVKGINYEDARLANVLTGYNSMSFNQFNSATLSSTANSRTASGNISTSITVPKDGGTVYINAPFTISYTDTQYSLNVNTGPSTVINGLSSQNISYAKAVVAETGAINSADGLIQSIS